MLLKLLPKRWTLMGAAVEIRDVMDGEPIHIDIERMKRALAGPRWTIPPGLSHEELSQFINDCAAGKVPPDNLA